MANLRLWVISKAEYDSEGVGYSTLMTDFPVVFGDPIQVGTIARQPIRWDGEQAWLIDAPVYSMSVTQEGILQHATLLTPLKDSDPPICVTEAIVPSAAVAQAIHTSAKHRVLALQTVDGSEPPIEGWGPNDPFSEARWTSIRNGIVALGLPAGPVDAWRVDHPEATPKEFYSALETYIQR